MKLRRCIAFCGLTLRNRGRPSVAPATLQCSHVSCQHLYLTGHISRVNHHFIQVIQGIADVLCMDTGDEVEHLSNQMPLTFMGKKTNVTSNNHVLRAQGPEDGA
jgi:hypothetical protein